MSSRSLQRLCRTREPIDRLDSDRPLVLAERGSEIREEGERLPLVGQVGEGELGNRRLAKAARLPYLELLNAQSTT